MMNRRALALLAARRLAAHRKPVVDARIAEASQAMRAALLRRDGRELHRQYAIICELRGGRPPPGRTVELRAQLMEKLAKFAAEAKARATMAPEDRAPEGVPSEGA
jgi:hypothetical protein